MSEECSLQCFGFHSFLLKSLLLASFQLQGMQSEAAVLSRPSLWREASRIINEEGFRAFWKGNLVTVAHRLPYSALNFYAYEQYKMVSCILIFSCLSMICHSGSQCYLFCSFCIQIQSYRVT